MRQILQRIEIWSSKLSRPEVWKDPGCTMQAAVDLDPALKSWQLATTPDACECRDPLREEPVQYPELLGKEGPSVAQLSFGCAKETTTVDLIVQSRSQPVI